MLLDPRLFPVGVSVFSKKRGISGVIDEKRTYNSAFVYVWWGTYLTEEWLGTWTSRPPWRC